MMRINKKNKTAANKPPDIISIRQQIIKAMDNIRPINSIKLYL